MEARRYTLALHLPVHLRKDERFMNYMFTNLRHRPTDQFYFQILLPSYAHLIGGASFMAPVYFLSLYARTAFQIKCKKSPPRYCPRCYETLSEAGLLCPDPVRSSFISVPPLSTFGKVDDEVVVSLTRK
ncbi:unnamed protein product [Somion occarium]|uniref:Uncharacterized protein n=1 Tax=Somion occarium TaxID=3059160 RepID=A0ABP1CQ43_9APHY